MSQAKVDRYKEEKKNRAQIIKKEKREENLFKICGGLLACAVAAWIGVSVYTAVKPAPPAEETAQTVENYTVDTSALDDFVSSMAVD
jgi:hypothetical protein